ncbi:LysR family transcriptional regulator [Hominifimenecus sp. rT4P-3]|uniref:LysR family transcriptional regulator n=1 Tax=Hominifimenecus sp. rT4P-3 TaxID=3242979 RepID=UPI003DA259C5
MEILQLQYFECVARHENVSKAALELMISQPALSNSIIRLEKELGITLFDRVGRKIYLNEQGKSLLANVKKILDLISRSKTNSRTALRQRTISMFHYIYSPTLMKAIAEFSSSHSETTFQISNTVRDSSINLPISNCDFIIHKNTTSLGFPHRSLPLETISYYAVLPKKHPLAQKESIHLYDLRNDSFCFLCSAGDFHLEPAYSFCLEAGFSPKIAFSTTRPYLKFFFLDEGTSVGIVTSVYLSHLKKFPAVTSVPLKGFEQYAQIQLSWKEDVPLSPEGNEFLSYIKQIIS